MNNQNISIKYEEEELYMSSSLDKGGFIGTGNMATAIIKGLIENGVNSKYVYAYDIDSEKLNKISKEYNITVVTSNIDVLDDP